MGRDIVLNALDLRRRVARDVMRPRQEIVALDTEATIAECLDLAEKTRYSRFPLCEDGDLDRTLGVVHIKDLYAMRLKARSGATCCRSPASSSMCRKRPAWKSCLKLFLERKLHLAIVVDEYGGTRGHGHPGEHPRGTGRARSRTSSTRKSRCSRVWTRRPGNWPAPCPCTNWRNWCGEPLARGRRHHRQRLGHPPARRLSQSGRHFEHRPVRGAGRRHGRHPRGQTAAEPEILTRGGFTTARRESPLPAPPRGSPLRTPPPARTG